MYYVFYYHDHIHLNTCKCNIHVFINFKDVYVCYHHQSQICNMQNNQLPDVQKVTVYGLIQPPVGLLGASPHPACSAMCRDLLLNNSLSHTTAFPATPSLSRFPSIIHLNGFNIARCGRHILCLLSPIKLSRERTFNWANSLLLPPRTAYIQVTPVW